MLTQALFLATGWFVISLLATLVGGAKVRRANLFLSVIWLSFVLVLGDLWVLLTFGVPWEILVTSALLSKPTGINSSVEIPAIKRWLKLKLTMYLAVIPGESAS